MSKTNFYLSSAIIANEFVKKKMTIGASNKLRWDFLTAWQCSGSLVNTGEMRKKVDRDVATTLTTETYIGEVDGGIKLQKIIMEKSADAAMQFGCGNCGEQSAIAFVYLRQQKILPLDWMQVNDYEHAFVVIGRQRGSDSRDFRTWGDEAVVCDPWRDVVGTVKSEARYFASRKPNWLYGEIA